MRALVSGASGQLGSFVVRDLLAHGHEVAIIVRSPEKAWRIADVLAKCTVFTGELENIQALQDSIVQWNPCTCFHIAWFGVTAEFRNDPRQVSVNALGTIALLSVLSRAGCKSFIGIGSQAEYGIVDGILTEEMPLAPVTAYGCTKQAVSILSEKFCALAGIRWVWLRLLATYGPADDERHLIPHVILQLLNGKKPSLTPAEQKWDYLYVEDAAQAVRLAGENELATGIMNLSCGDSRKVCWIVNRIRDEIDENLPIGIGDQSYRPDQVMLLEADISKIKAVLGWRPSTTWENGIAQTVKWYSTRPLFL